MAMRELTRQERAAMWIYRYDYANSGLSAIEFYKRLPCERKAGVDEMLRELDSPWQRKAREVLRSVEWIWMGDAEPHCPMCLRQKGDGHERGDGGCRLAALLEGEDGK